MQTSKPEFKQDFLIKKEDLDLIYCALVIGYIHTGPTQFDASSAAVVMKAMNRPTTLQMYCAAAKTITGNTLGLSPEDIVAWRDRHNRIAAYILAMCPDTDENKQKAWKVFTESASRPLV